MKLYVTEGGELAILCLFKIVCGDAPIEGFGELKIMESVGTAVDIG